MSRSRLSNSVSQIFASSVDAAAATEGSWPAAVPVPMVEGEEGEEEEVVVLVLSEVEGMLTEETADSFSVFVLLYTCKMCRDSACGDAGCVNGNGNGNGDGNMVDAVWVLVELLLLLLGSDELPRSV